MIFMSDYQSIFNEILKVLNKNFVVFGFSLNIISVFVGIAILSIVFFAVRKIFY